MISLICPRKTLRIGQSVLAQYRNRSVRLYHYIPANVNIHIIPSITSPLRHGSYRHSVSILNLSSKWESNNRVPQYRSLMVSNYLCESSSSKVEETVKTLKNKQKEQEQKESAQIPTLHAETIKEVVVKKKSLPQRIWEEILHYYHGFRLLYLDLKVCQKLVVKLISGNKLNRRENKLLIRTTSDLFRLLPFSIFIVIPFMELLLPLYLKFLPGMLPSTFTTKQQHENQLKSNLKMKLEVAKFLQQTLDEMVVQNKERKSEDAKEFTDFFKKIKTRPHDFIDNKDIIKFSKQFEDEITVDSLTREQLTALCRVLEANTVGTRNMLRFQLRLRLRSIAADDRVISREGVNSLNLFELQQACKMRGMRAYGLSIEKLHHQLQEWINLSVNEKVPLTLLLLSRALMIADDVPTEDKLKQTIRVLPDAVAAQTRAAISEREGKIDHQTQIEIIKEEQRQIQEEHEEESELEKNKQIATPVDSIIRTKTKCADGATISPKDAQLLGEALKSVVDKHLLAEKEAIRDLKEEIQDYKEDVEELKEIATSEAVNNVKESRGAKILFKKVTTMIGKLDKVVNDLEQKGKTLQKSAEGNPQESLVRIDELINAIKQMQNTSDRTRLKFIEKVLGKIDFDHDGTISATDLFKVMETIMREDVKLSEKEVEELLDLIEKEEIIEAEVKVEKALEKSIKEAGNTVKAAEAIQDKTEDLNVIDKKNDIKDKFSETDVKTSKTEAGAAQITENLTKPDPIPTNLPPTIPPPPSPSSKSNLKDKSL